MKKKRQTNLPKADGNTPDEYFARLMNKYSALGRSPTPEEVVEDFKVWHSSPPLTKGQIRERKIQRLEEYIELANKIPPDFPELDLVEKIVRSLNPSLQEGTIEFSVAKFKLLLELLGGPKVPATLREHILEGVTDKAKDFTADKYDPDDLSSVSLVSAIYEALYRFNLCLEVRRRLRQIISATVRSNQPALSFREAVLGFLQRIEISSEIVIDSSGILQLSSDDFAETVQGLEAGRIRECPICQRIFWAHPISKMSCSPRCRNLFNVRRHRAMMKQFKAR